ncbi:MAG: phosphoribosylaminoimidazolesuccinocarboxamide synthase [Oscillospiraceae bacterium]|nr:phosphoribosylaminoimidazolesuccinocarboxamide synthase [Oscillospiraceae bacterium]MCL2279905.1 phosphoribosylaminoimidazolesuccinocarboxamide synthase [Oscillospiraceae bacterium]
MELYKGKTKIVCQGTDENTVILRFTDNVTAFNGEKCEALPGKGETGFAFSNLLYGFLEQNGIETHMVEIIDEATVEVKKAEIVGVEVIVRNVAAGGFVKKYGAKEGTVFDEPVVEFCLKSDELGDPLINESQIRALEIATDDELAEMMRQALKINKLLCALFKKAGIRLVDFKLEFGRYENRLILCDELSPDSCRLWDVETGEKFDKDIFRQDLGDLVSGYTEVFDRLSKTLTVV